MRSAVFLDRDDTLIENRSVTEGTAFPGDLFEPGLVRLCGGVARGCRALADAGYVLVVVSNQGGVARGACTISQVRATNQRMRELLRGDPDAGDGGVELAGVYFCPFHPKGRVAPYNVEHEWRKPAPGMIVHACLDLGIDAGGSWMVGDSERDVEAGTRAGIPAERCLRLGAEGLASFADCVARILRQHQ